MLIIFICGHWRDGQCSPRKGSCDSRWFLRTISGRCPASPSDDSDAAQKRGRCRFRVAVGRSGAPLVAAARPHARRELHPPQLHPARGLPPHPLGADRALAEPSTVSRRSDLVWAAPRSARSEPRASDAQAGAPRPSGAGPLSGICASCPVARARAQLARMAEPWRRAPVAARSLPPHTWAGAPKRQRGGCATRAQGALQGSDRGVALCRGSAFGSAGWPGS